MNNSSEIINFELHNKPAVAVLVILFVSMILPLVSLVGNSISYFKLVGNSNLQVIFFLLSGASLVIGFPRIITRIVSAIFIIVVLIPVYDAISPFIKMGSSLNEAGMLEGIFNNMDNLKVMGVGLPLLVISIVVYAILQFTPHYQTNKKWTNRNSSD